MRSLIAVVLCLTGPVLGAAQTATGAQTAPPYTEIFYKHADLRLQAYLYKPAGNGPFPLIIYPPFTPYRPR